MLLPHLKAGRIEAGCDEAGRGCLAGSVFAAAVVFPSDYHNERLDDSKKLTSKQREALRLIIEKDAIAWAVESVSPKEIDNINILQASILAMHKALDALSTRPEFILVDGNKFVPYQDIPHKTIVKGDGKFLSIAAASILAKTHRDEYMRTLHQEYPAYNWIQNAGYPTREHRNAIAKNGITPYHRMTFKLLPDDSENLILK